MDLSFFLNNNILDSGNWFFKEILNINISPAVRSGLDLKTFLDGYLSDEKLLQKVADARLIGMVNDNSLQEKIQKKSPEEVLKTEKEDYDLILVFGIELAEDVQPTKSDISRLTRALNRRSASRPVVLLTRYSDKLTFSAAERGEYKKKGQKGEKIGRISILRDINLNKEAIHSGHERILLQLRVNPLKVTNFKELYDAWLEVFNISTLNKEFYSELFTWYLWAVKTVKFPNKVNDTRDDTVYNSENVIRLLTRLIFIWFVKEKKLIPDNLFDKNYLSGVLTKFNPISDSGSDYYKAILQNLFFATLNTEMPVDGGVRKFLDETKKNKKTGYSDEYMDHLSFRHKELFSDPWVALKMFENIPFLNGGLFECLDHRDPETDEEIRIDGFSSKPSKQPTVPNILFFGTNNDLDLSSEFEDGKKHTHSKARGIINILNSYKFTIEENTPLEQEIALDPELLGKIFENLLASYNPETRTTARKQTGSYYTPREIVNYMVDESLIAYLKTKLSEQPVSYQALGGKQTNFLGNEFKSGQLDIQVELAYNKWKGKEEDLEEKLHNLFSYEFEENPFNGDKETSDAIIAHLSECKILDPACGSGAFPMGILHKIVLALGKLDPCNFSWKQAQLDKAVRDRQRAEEFEDDALKNDAIKRAEEKIRYIEESFGDTGHELDYARKLFLIENCIYGVDIQQVAVQISKLRFFISLMVDQQVNDRKYNRNIMSLPNLETKFVAANTLIPIERPLQLLLKDPEVEKYEKTLQEIHHKIFYTRGYAEKKKLKKEELETRKHLRKLYIDRAGYKKEAAEAITKWNPFDPLMAAPFFDPGVMFKIEKKGNIGYFDVIIGNPPYVRVDEIKKEDKLIYKNKFRSSTGKYDLYYLFIERCEVFITKIGSLAFIIPNKICAATSAETIRNIIFNSRRSIRIVGTTKIKVFQASNYPIIIHLGGPKKAMIEFREAKSLSNLAETTSNYFFIQEDEIILLPYKVIPLNASRREIDIMINIIKISKPLKEFLSISEGLRIDKSSESDDPSDLPIVKQYQFSKWTSITKASYINQLNLESICPKSTTRYKRIFSEKILFAEDALQISATLDDLNYIPQGGVYFGVKNSNLSHYSLLAIINSSLLSFIYEKLCSGMHMGGGYLRYRAQFLEMLPIVVPRPNIANFIEQQCKKLLLKNGEDKISKNFLRILDLLIYKLYSLRFEECLIIDSNIENLFSQEDYDSKSIDELADCINPTKDKPS